MVRPLNPKLQAYLAPKPKSSPGPCSLCQLRGAQEAGARHSQAMDHWVAIHEPMSLREAPERHTICRMQCKPGKSQGLALS